MLLSLANPIFHQKQPTPLCCTATCIAMAVGIRVEDLGVDLSKPYDFGLPAVWLAERGIWFRPMARYGDYGEPFKSGRLYLVAIRSLNNVGGDHAVLLDTRGEPKSDGHERSGWKTFDPKGIEGKKTCQWVAEYDVVEAGELMQRNLRFRQFGTPP